MKLRALLAIFSSTLFLFGAGAAPARAADALDQQHAADFVTGVIHDAFAALAGKTLSREERADVLATLIQHYANLERTSQDLLGRSWASASDSDQTLFRQTLLAYMLAVWSEPLGDVSPTEQITVTGAEPRGDRMVVKSLASSPGEQPTPVEWIVGTSPDDRLFVADVSVEGISLIRMMRSDFTSVLFANAGHLGGLIAGMQKKIQSVNDDAQQRLARR
jgi:ABC-type transporter MlaC component